jgi:peptidoglycan hydrolase-like protein with peptidoglycan-binding domain
VVDPSGRGNSTAGTTIWRAAVLGLLLVLVTATAVSAHSQPNAWKNGDAVGTSCGLSNGTYVKSWQSILWAADNLANLSEIDGAFGPVTRAATSNYQSNHSLSADGCAGYFTWDNAKNSGHTVGGTFRRHLTLLATNISCPGSGQNLCERHEWREKTSSRYVRYILDPYFGSINPPFPGCWHLVKAVNSSNGSSKAFNSWINHGSLNSC